MSPRESTENERIGAHGLNCKIFRNSEVIFGFNDKNYPRKKILCLCDTFEIFVNFEISPILEISNGHFCEMTKNIVNFFS